MASFLPAIKIRDRTSRPRRRSGGLTLRILAVNAVAPFILVLGILYMGQYQDGLINAELETLKGQTGIIAAAIAEGAADAGHTDSLIDRVAENTGSRTRLFDSSGTPVADSHDHREGRIPEAAPAAPEEENAVSLATVLRYLTQQALAVIPGKDLNSYPTGQLLKQDDFPDARMAAASGVPAATAWKDERGRIILSAAAPVRREGNTSGVVLLTRDGSEIERAMVQVRFDVFTVFLGALSITIFLSVYLAGVIGRPLQRLAIAAEAIRQGKGRQTDIPDLGGRGDEIGELSLALRAMTKALWDRMDSIEAFAADVAHEIKNPLTSLRSAVETAAVVRNEDDREKLMKIIQHDVQRLDRLISDISNASRLDAELSRDEMGTVDLAALLTGLADMRGDPLQRSGKNIQHKTGINIELPEGPVMVRGNEGRLAQVFENLISNALSFSPAESAVTVRIEPGRETVCVTVEDKGPGIPENKLETIFERFYSERPAHEDYGAHSGLGLSIAKQIVEAHGGEIYADNIRDGSGQITGACFTVILDAAT